MPVALESPLAPPRWRNRRRRLLAVAVVVLALLIAHRTGALDAVTDQDHLRRLADGAGWWGPIAFSALFIALVPVGVPGLVFVLPAAVVFPAPTAIVVSLAGGYGSSAIGMWFARTIGRQHVATRLPARFRAWDDRIARRGLAAVIVLRLVTYLAAPADWVLGLTKISTRDLVLGTAIGLVPPTLLYVFAGGGLLDLVL